MSFRGRIFIALMGLGLAPLVVTGWLSYSTSREELAQAVGQSQMRAVEQLATSLERTVREAMENVRLATEYIPFHELGPEELTTVLQIPYRQFSSLSIIGLFRPDGSSVVSPIFRPVDSQEEQLAEHEPIGSADLEIFAANVPPLDEVMKRGLVAGPPHQSPEGAPRVTVALRIDTEPILLLAAELSLRDVQKHMQQVAEVTGLVYAVAQGKAFAASESGVLLSEDELRIIEQVSASRIATAQTVVRPDGREWFAAFGPIGTLGWTLVVGQPSDVAFGGARRVREFNIAWAGIVLLLIVGVGALMSRGLTQPIESLSKTVRALGAGRYDVRTEVSRRDELGRFADTLNHMASEIQTREEEIRNWNEELQRRVEARTSELEQAQGQILRSQRLTALGSMGAGLAHELNNPMAGILGLVNLMREESEEGTDTHNMLKMVHEQAVRITGIVRSFQDFAEREQRSSGRPVSPIRLVRSALHQQEQRLRDRHIEVLVVHRDGVPKTIGDEEQLTDVFTHIIDNATEAMPGGGRLTLTISGVGSGAVQVKAEDTGSGIERGHLERIFDPFFSTKTTAHNPGMGLSVAHQIVETHGGEIQVKSDVGHGSTFSVLLPAAAADAHLV